MNPQLRPAGGQPFGEPHVQPHLPPLFSGAHPDQNPAAPKTYNGHDGFSAGAGNVAGFTQGPFPQQNKGGLPNGQPPQMLARHPVQGGPQGPGHAQGPTLAPVQGGLHTPLGPMQGPMLVPGQPPLHGHAAAPGMAPPTSQAQGGPMHDQLAGQMGGLSLSQRPHIPQGPLGPSRVSGTNQPPGPQQAAPQFQRYPPGPPSFGGAPPQQQQQPYYGGPPPASSQGPPLGPSQGPPQGSFQGSPQGPPQGLPQGPPQGPSQGHPQGHPQGPPQGPPHGPPQGPPQGSLQSPPQGFSQGHPQGLPQGHLQGPHQGFPQGPLHGPPQGIPHGPPHGPPQGLSHGPPQGMPHGPPHGPPHGHSQGPPPGAPYPQANGPGSLGPGMGYGGAPQGYGGPQMGHGAQPPQPQQAQRKLDPDQMPSPIQVIEDDRKARGGPFYTSKRGLVPPLVTTDFVVHDEGICSPRFVRSTVYSVPCNPDVLRQTAVPFALCISPFARLAPGESELPLSDFGEEGPVRCNRCKAYMCPLMQFIDGGRRFQCVFCKGTTEVPAHYFAHLDHLGQRSDKFQRPELCLGSYEVVATREYCKNSVFPNPPAFLFLLDVSYNSVRNGLVRLFCTHIRSILDELPKEEGQDRSRVRVGFITYSSVVHFYNIKSSLAQPQMLVVPDVHDMFVPLLDGCLVSVEEAASTVDSLLEQIPGLFADTRETDTVLGSAIQAGLEALKAAECAGKLFVFHTSLPIADAPGKLKNRDDRKLLSTDKEKTILTPQSPFYNQLGQECVAAGCCVDLFLFHNAYVDIATIGQVAKMTGGQVYKYTYFQEDVEGSRFLEDLRRDVSQPVAFDAVMRVRTSTGIRPTDFYGNYYMANTTDVELAALDCNKCIAVEIKYDDKLVEEEGAYVQVALLYTTCGGQRRLRLHNLSLATCVQMADMYRNCDLDTMVNFLAKQGVRHLLEQGPRQVKEGCVSKAAQMLAAYRKHCASPSSSGQLILPECMKLLPLYLNCLLKSDALSGGPELTTDDRSFAMLSLCSMDVASTVAYFYPRLLPLHDVDVDAVDLPVALRCTAEKVREDGVYLLENGIHMFMWIGMAVDPDFLQNVFAQPVAARIDIDKTALLELNTPISRRVRDIVARVRAERQRCMRLTLVRQGDKMELVFRQFLVEDRHGEASPSYVDFLCHLHKEIRNLLS
ncbi:protein transport protein Sec24C isoform X3 [Ixodes scapularis]|uniref:protein transport protein Sec24C isoform X3 n=1 Tax=Ixodes scapularis TaxID=6945 RepID=UPI001A9F777A|nr:protein transport protein Sec24C isoform X3 [Ixodes scapularis]XP_040360067.1 protein transport protein Sec24C isoform X3 [Ixodes scapularis]